MDTRNNPRSVTLIITIIICTTIVLVSAIGGWAYMQNQKLSQDKALKEQELQIQKDSSKEQADAVRDAAKSECMGNSTELWQRMGC